MSFSTRAARPALAGFLFLTLSACQSLYQTVPPLEDLKTNRPTGVNDQFRSVAKAANDWSTYANRVSKYQSDTALGRAALGYLTFGAALTGTTGALYGAHSDFVLASGLVATTSYTSGSLFVPQTEEQIYAAAAAEFRCVVRGADQLISEGVFMKTEASNLDNPIDELRIYAGLDGKTLGKDGETAVAAAGVALEKAVAAKQNIESFLNGDATFATVVNQTADSVLKVMSDRLYAQAPTLEQIRNAVGGIGGASITQVERSVTLAKSAEDAVVAKGIKALQYALNLQTNTYRPDVILARAEQVTAKAVLLNERIRKALNAINSLGQTCVLNLPATPGLSLSQNSINVSDNQTFVILAQGGRLPISARWSGRQPDPAKVDLRVVGNEIIIITRQGLAKNDMYTALVTDTMATPNRAMIEVHTPRDQTANQNLSVGDGGTLSLDNNDITMKPSFGTSTVTLSGGSGEYKIADGTGVPPWLESIAVEGATVSVTFKADYEFTGAEQPFTAKFEDTSSPVQSVNLIIRPARG